MELQPASVSLCEYNSLLVDSCDLNYTRISEPCDKLQISNFKHVVLITHKEMLARIPLDTILYYIMLDEPMSVNCAMNKISEISYLRSGTHACCFTFNLIGDHSMNENFLVDYICITYDKIDELKRVVFSHRYYVPKSFCVGTIPNSHDNMTYSRLVDLLQQTKVASPLLKCSDLARFDYDYAHTYFDMRATLLTTVQDYPGCSYVSAQVGHGFCACVR